MKKLMLIMLLGLFLISFGIAVKQNDCIIINAQCPNCTYMNLTSVKYANTSNYALWGQYAMTQNGGEYNYTFCDTGFLGTYDWSACGDVDGDYDCTSGGFVVTPSGISQSISQGINSAAFLFLMFGLTIFLGYLGFKFLENDYLWVLGLFLIFVMFIFMVYDVWLGYEYHLTLTGINTGSNVPQIIFFIFMFVLVTSFLTSGILLFTHWKEILKYWKKLKEERKREAQEREFEWV